LWVNELNTKTNIMMSENEANFRKKMFEASWINYRLFWLDFIKLRIGKNVFKTKEALINSIVQIAMIYNIAPKHFALKWMGNSKEGIYKNLHFSPKSSWSLRVQAIHNKK
jgi:hypothetical protein